MRRVLGRVASFKNNILAGTLTNFNSTGGLTTNSVTSIDSSAWGTVTGPLIQLKANANLRYVTDNNALYSQLPRAQLVQRLDLVPNTHGLIEILNSFAPSSYFAPTDARCVPPLLVYADLLASQRSGAEALAQQLRTALLVDLGQAAW